MSSLFRAQKRLYRQKYGYREFNVAQKTAIANAVLSIIAGIFVVSAYAWMSTDDQEQQERAEQQQQEAVAAAKKNAHEMAQRMRDQGLLDDATAMASPVAEDKRP